jgi:hypothetical protein
LFQRRQLLPCRHGKANIEIPDIGTMNGKERVPRGSRANPFRKGIVGSDRIGRRPWTRLGIN